MPQRRKTAQTIGRPPKFSGPTRVVTMTLPEATLRDLELIDRDRARAIVRATELALSLSDTNEEGVKLQAVNRDTALITVPFSRLLQEIDGLTLVEILPRRYLVILEDGTSMPEAELALLDRIDALEEGEDRSVLVQLLEHLRTYRRSQRATTQELILISL